MPFHNYKYGKSKYSGPFRFRKSIKAGTPYMAYTAAKQAWRRSAIYNKPALQRNFGYSKQLTVNARRYAGAQTGGFLQSARRSRTSTLLPQSLPRVGGKTLKIHDSGSDGIAVIQPKGSTMAPQILQLVSSGTGIILGTSVFTRVGDKVHLKRLELSGVLGYPTLDTGLAGDTAMGQGQMRMLIVVDKQSNQALATVAQVLEGSDAILFSTRQKNFSNRRRFDILCDKLYTIPSQRSVIDGDSGETIAQRSTVPLTMSMDLTQTIKYSEQSTTGDGGDIVENNIYLIIGCDHLDPAVGVTDEKSKYTWNYNSRIMFT